MLRDLMSLIVRFVEAHERLAAAQMAIAATDPFAGERIDPDEVAGPAAGAQAARREEEEPADEKPARQIGPEEVREALVAVTQSGKAGKDKARKVLTSFKDEEGSAITKVSQIPAGLMAEVHAALLKAI